MRLKKDLKMYIIEHFTKKPDINIRVRFYNSSYKLNFMQDTDYLSECGITRDYTVYI